MSTVGSSKSGHRHSNDALAVQPQLIERTHADQQRQRGVQSTTDTYHHMFTMGVRQSFGKTGSLDIQYFLAGLCHLRMGGDEGMRVDITD